MSSRRRIPETVCRLAVKGSGPELYDPDGLNAGLLVALEKYHSFIEDDVFVATSQRRTIGLLP